MDRSGLLPPIRVRRKSKRFEVVAGERRFRAAKLLQWSTIACRVAELSDLDADVNKLVENEQRAEIQKLVAEESIRPTYLRSLKAVADESKRVELAAQVAKESRRLPHSPQYDSVIKP